MSIQMLEGIRLSPEQKHLWLLQQKQKQNQPYRSQCAVLIEGNLKQNILKTSIQNTIDRQEILRTNFKCLPGMEIPIQVINNSKISWNYEDITSSSTEQQKIILDQMNNHLLQLSFDYQSGRLLYLSLLKLSLQKYILFISLPALCADSITLNNLVSEISLAYQACLDGQEINDLEVIQYADLAEWQNELLESEETAIGREYWQKKNLVQLLNLHLPFENHSIVDSNFKPQKFSLLIASNLLKEITLFAQKEDSSLAILLLTCWQILLMRLTGQSESIIGIANDGRKYEELNNALGLLTKYLPVHCHLFDTSQVLEILKQNEQLISETNEWQDSFDWSYIQNKQSNDISFLPFCFNFQLESIKYCASNIYFSIIQKSSYIDQFKIQCSCRHQNSSLIIDFEYDSDLFSEKDIQRLSKQFETLLRNIIAHSSATIGELEIVDYVESQQLLLEFNKTQIKYPKNKCIHHLFEEQVKQTPNEIAVVVNQEELTYQELNNRANQLARYLIQLGVKPEVIVGICIERSLDMIVSILGVLKAGGAYLPLDPSYPQERLEFLLSDTQTPIVLTQQHLAEGLSTHKTICLDTDWETIAQESQINPVSRIESANLVYVIYTSGSTGKPKGVKVTHRNLVNSTIARINYYQEPVTNFLLLSSFAFDSSIVGIFGTLCRGGTLILPQEGEEKDLSKLTELIEQNQISHTLSLPSLYGLLLEQTQPEQLQLLRTVIVAGEICPKILQQQHSKLLPETSLFNEYGPTEATVWSTVHHCRDRDVELKTQVSIGHPIANTQIYLLDSYLHLVPLGIPGEIYIGGDNLAQGYLNRPDLTATRFIPNPFSQKLGTRLYRTGDLARYLPDGSIEFLGRIDRQVKIRGFRIELSEIEALLNQHPTVRSLAVIAREDEPGNKRIVAYIVLKDRLIRPKSTELRHFLREKLPEYMVPSAFVKLDSLPFLPNGKVDIKALPAPENIRDDLSSTFVAPQTSTEKAIADIWLEILSIERVGIHDDFFELGGHSLLATQVVSRIRQALQTELSLRQFFDAPIVADLAVVIAQNLAQDADEEMLATMLDELEELPEPILTEEEINE